MKLSRSAQHPVSGLFADFDQLINRAFNGTLFHGNQASDSSLGVYEDEKAWHLRTDLPGFRKEDVTLRVEDGVLVLDAEQKEGENRFQASAHRSLKLPDNVEVSAIEARLEHGVLEVTLPKSAPEKPEAVQITIK